MCTALPGTGSGLALGLLGGQIALSTMYGPLAAFFAELFNARRWH